MKLYEKLFEIVDEIVLGKFGYFFLVVIGISITTFLVRTFLCEIVIVYKWRKKRK